MRNFIQPGHILTLTAPYARSAGQGALVGGIFGVALSDVANAADGEFQTEGVFELTKVGSQAWTQGQRIYWDDSNKRCTSDGTAGQFIGHATEAVGSGAGVVLGKVHVCCCSPLLEGPQAVEAALTGTLTGTANGSMVDVAAAAGACAGGATPTATNVDTAIATAVAPIVSGTNEQLKELQTTVNSLITKLKAAGVIASA